MSQLRSFKTHQPHTLLPRCHRYAVLAQTKELLRNMSELFIAIHAVLTNKTGNKGTFFYEKPTK